MRTARNLTAVLAFMLVLVGCATSPVGKYNQTNEAFIAVVDTAVTARQTGQVNDDDWVVVVDYINSGHAILGQMRVITDNGGDPASFENIIALLIAQIEQYLPETD